MCNRNATATWSGFAHQGQVGLLVALRKMKEVDEAEYPNYFLEYEKREDVAIYKNNEHKEYISVHQVKAYYSGGNYKSKYDKVLNEDFEICGNDYLHTVMEITDWDTSETTNNYNIQRYTYGETQFHSDTEDIEGFILNELQEISDDNVQPKALLQRLTYELDLQIRTEHKKGKKKLFDVKFSFEQISQIIAEGILKANEIETYECRKLFYELYKDEIKSRDVADDHLRKITEEIIEKIYQLPDSDFIRFLKLLNLSESPEYLSSPLFQFNPEGYRSVFFDVLLDVDKTSGIFLQESVQYKMSNSSDILILTSIIREFNRDEMVVNIIKNLKQMEVLWEGYQLINRHHNGKFIDHYKNLKNMVIKDEIESPINYYSRKGGLIKRDDAKTLLNND